MCGRPRYDAKLLDVGRRSSRGFPLSSFSAERTLMCGSSSWRVSWTRDQPVFQTHANVCWCSETQWSTDETFRINQRFPSVLERFFVAARNAPKQFGRRAVLVEFDETGFTQIDGEASNADNATPRSQAVLHTSDTSFRQPTCGNTSVESTERLPNKPSAGSTKCTQS